MRLDISIESWTSAHKRFEELKQIIDSEGQGSWFSFKADWHLSSHTLVALHQDQIVGFLYFVIQEIGPELDRPSAKLNDVALLEAKVIAFGVVSDMRDKGVGRKLQEEAMGLARAAHCHQLRSHSSGTNKANHHLKLSMGFAVDPIVRGNDKEGVYFIMSLNPLNR